MKSLILTFLLFLALLGHAQVNDDNSFFFGTYNKEFIRKNKIEKITIQTYFGTSKSLTFEHTFDEQGFLRERSTLDSNGKKTGNYLFEYNTKGDQLKVTNNDIEFKKTYVTTFDRKYANELLIWERSTNFPFDTFYTYNAAGLRIRSDVYLTSDTTAGRKKVKEYVYDDHSRLARTEEYFIENGITTPDPYGRTDYLYDNATSRVISTRRENGATYHYSYDNQGLLKTIHRDMNEEFAHLNMVDKYFYRFRN